MPAMIAAEYQCENEPNDMPIGVTDRDTESRATPTTRTTAPVISMNRTLPRIEMHLLSAQCAGG